MGTHIGDTHRGRTVRMHNATLNIMIVNNKCTFKKIYIFRGMVENLVFLLEKLGFVPNGGRVYYTRGDLNIFKAPNPIFISSKY